MSIQWTDDDDDDDDYVKRALQGSRSVHSREGVKSIGLRMSEVYIHYDYFQSRRSRDEDTSGTVGSVAGMELRFIDKT